MKNIIIVLSLIIITPMVANANVTKNLKNSVINGFGLTVGRDLAKETIKKIKLVKVDSNLKTKSGKKIKIVKLVADSTKINNNLKSK